MQNFLACFEKRNPTCSLFDLPPARATVRAPLGVERAAARAGAVHRAREPLRDERAHAKDGDEQGDADERVFQLWCRPRMLS